MTTPSESFYPDLETLARISLEADLAAMVTDDPVQVLASVADVPSLYAIGAKRAVMVSAEPLQEGETLSQLVMAGWLDGFYVGAKFAAEQNGAKDGVADSG